MEDTFWNSGSGGGRIVYGKARRKQEPVNETEALKDLIKKKNKEIEKLKQEIADLVILNIPPEKKDVV